MTSQYSLRLHTSTEFLRRSGRQAGALEWTSELARLGLGSTPTGAAPHCA